MDTLYEIIFSHQITTSFDIRSCLNDLRYLDDPILGPLTDFEYTTDEDEPIKIYPLKRPDTAPAIPRASTEANVTRKQSDYKELTKAYKKHRNRSSNERMRRKRAEARLNDKKLNNTDLKKCSRNRRATASTTGLVIPRDIIEVLKVSKPGWIGVRRAREERYYGIEELVEDWGMREFKWDGRYAM